MKRSKFNEGQIAYILRQAEEGRAISEVCRKAVISKATFYVAEEVCGHDAIGDEEAETAGGRERRAEDCRGSLAG
jgi:hypothetical protein